MKLKTIGILLGILSFLGCTTTKPIQSVYSSEYKPAKRHGYSGWDNNGRLKENSKVQTLSFQSGLTILNEDAIICEEIGFLVDNYNLSLDYPTGRMLYNLKKNTLEEGKDDVYFSGDKQLQLESRKNDAFIGVPFQKENELTKINKSLKVERIENEINNEKNRVKEEEKWVEKQSKYIMGCTVNEEPKLIEIIERKPISKIVKIKLKLNGFFTELWTYESHLTFNDQEKKPSL